MRRLAFLKLLVILTCFVTGGILAGSAIAGGMTSGSNKNVLINVEELKGENGPDSISANEKNIHKTVISAAGDVLLAAGVGEAIKAYGPDYPWRGVSVALRHSDITIANLECPVSVSGEPVPEKQYTFRASPDSLKGAEHAGMDIFTLANNHILDYGQQALLETIKYLNENGIKHTGAGIDEEDAYKPVIIKKNGIRIAIFAFSRVIPDTGWNAADNRPGVASGYNWDRVLDAIRSVRGKADRIVVSIHWGTELKDTPNSDQVSLAHKLIDSGVDAVIGAHPHVLQGVEIYKGKLIAYSLGNFIFTSSSQKAREGAILQIVFDDTGKYTARLIPTYISNGSTAILSGSGRESVLDRINMLSAGFGSFVAGDGEIKVAK